jgi:hypothetical protein
MVALPAVFGVVGAALSLWTWVAFASYDCPRCDDDGLGKAIAIIVTVVWLIAWVVGTGVYSAGYAFGRALSCGRAPNTGG